MGFTKKTWKNRIAEYINRRLITMEDGSTSLVTVARDEGTISQEGDAFNAANMNNLEDRIAAGFEEINQSLTNIQYFKIAEFNASWLPNVFPTGQFMYGFCLATDIGLQGAYIPIVTMSWLGASVQASVWQLALTSLGVKARYNTSSTAWSAWA